MQGGETGLFLVVASTAQREPGAGLADKRAAGELVHHLAENARGIGASLVCAHSELLKLKVVVMNLRQLESQFNCETR